MNDELLKEYRKFRGVGYRPGSALYGARAVLAFAELEADDRAEINADAEQSGYFDVYGDPEGYEDAYGRWHSPEQERDEIIEMIDRTGCWVVYVTLDGETLDSVGMCAGYDDPTDALQNCYVPDLMMAAVERARDAQGYALDL